MKYVILFLIIPLFSFSQYIDENLKEYTDEFVYEANRRGLNGEKSLSRIDSIILKPLSYKYLGLYFKQRNVIEINSVYFFDRDLMRNTVFHELGHRNGLNHICSTCTAIMSVYNLNVRKSQKDWQNSLDFFFKRSVK